jgi:hypothetical protein
MMHRNGDPPEYSAPCKWDNDAPYVTARGNWRREVMWRVEVFQGSERPYAVLEAWLKQLGLMVTGIA